MTKNYAVKVTEENIFVIVAFAEQHQLKLDHLSDTLHINAKKGLDTWAILTRDDTLMTQRIAKINEMDFFGMYKLHNGSTVTLSALDFFQEIKHV